MLSLAALLIASSAAAQPVRLAVSAYGFTGELERMISAEVEDVVLTSSASADVHLSMYARMGTFHISVAGREGSMGERTVPEAAGTASALRLATLLATRAIESIRGLDEPMEIPPLEGELRVFASAAMLISWWKTPATPTFGIGGAAGIELGAFELGVVVAELGQPCCARTIARIHGEATELLVFAEGAWTPLRQGPFRLRVRLGAGADWVRVDATPRVMVPGVRAAVTRVSGIQGIVRAGATAEMEIVPDRAWFAGGGGVWWRVGDFEIRNIDGDLLEPGTLVPWVELRLGLHLL